MKYQNELLWPGTVCIRAQVQSISLQVALDAPVVLKH